MKSEMLSKIPYIYRPKQILKRIWYEVVEMGEVENARLAWNSNLKVWSSDSIGRSILHHGVHELPVVESCFRLANRGDLVIDVGAHVGQMTSALAHAVGPEGTVIAVEPHPLIFKMLQENSNYIQKETLASIHTKKIAVSDENREKKLYRPPIWSKKGNMGTASIERKKNENYSWVDCKRIDELTTEKIEVIKIDTEGHEKEVIEGAKNMIEKRKIVHIIFETHDEKKEVREILENEGYSILSIGCSILKPYVSKKINSEEGMSRSLIGTMKPKIVKDAFKSRGYVSLKCKNL